jgi:uncharacterized protein YbbC (DUF1343 family)
MNPILPGIDVLIQQRLDLIAGRRAALISNASAVTRDLTGTVDALWRAPQVQLVALFGPEHGFYTAAADGASVEAMTDAHTGLPVYSLYGDLYKPTAEMLAGLDVLIFDIQSVGVRFYTYITTLLYIMQAVAEHGLPLIVCDRPNPIGGELLEGPLLVPGFESFIGPGPLPVRHGLTIGELARLYNTVWGVGCDLTVVPCAGWQRHMWFDQTGLPWVATSPGIPTLATTTVYPGTCFIEGTNLSEGRGTTLPFELIGAPYVDSWVLADALNRLELPGVKFRPAPFEPVSSKWAGQMCGGVQLHVLDRHSFRPVTVGLHLLATLKAIYPDQFVWRLPHFDRLLGTDRVRQQLDAGAPVPDIVAGWASDLETFAAQRRQVLLY